MWKTIGEKEKTMKKIESNFLHSFFKVLNFSTGRDIREGGSDCQSQTPNCL
jgi:hypothetical protein